MSCFPCFQSQKSKKSISKREYESPSKSENTPPPAAAAETKKQKTEEGEGEEERGSDVGENECSQTHSFTFRELATATKNFRQECLLGEGGFGKVFKGTLASTGQVVAVKQLDRNGMQGNYNEFLAEVEVLSLLRHPNLVDLIGYCADGDQRLLVYELITDGSLEDRLHAGCGEKKPLDWIGRIKIALGTAKGLEYLHETADPPVVYRDLKPSNILLDKELNPKLSDYGLAKLNPSGAKMHVVMGTYGYCAPEYARASELTLKSDVYSFGVILLELITGRRAIDTTKPTDEQNLVSWAQPIFRDPKRFPDMADPLLNRHFPEKDLNQAVAIAAMCLQEEAGARPLMSDVMTALSFLSMNPEDCIPPPMPPSTPPSEEKGTGDHHKQEDKDGSDSEGSSSDDEGDEGSDEDERKRDDDKGRSEHEHGGNSSSSEEEDNNISNRRSSMNNGTRDDDGDDQEESSSDDDDHEKCKWDSSQSGKRRSSKSRNRSRRRSSRSGGSHEEEMRRKSTNNRNLSRRSSSMGSNDRYESFCDRLSNGSQDEKFSFDDDDEERSHDDEEGSGHLHRTRSKDSEEDD
ncbi:hypothetical protein Tsubulata_015160 [Turnera subulata]|uniref:Protein kinase domain-containing protein n=1 Tax=Turnera subulata TaxID=218843 RepID=A0A9Q0FRN4_9ROSI|nr:hypothetical protein Tsubulata_015160 [Turnera subulata]